MHCRLATGRKPSASAPPDLQTEEYACDLAQQISSCSDLLSTLHLPAAQQQLLRHAWRPLTAWLQTGYHDAPSDQEPAAHSASKLYAHCKAAIEQLTSRQALSVISGAFLRCHLQHASFLQQQGSLNALCRSHEAYITCLLAGNEVCGQQYLAPALAALLQNEMQSATILYCPDLMRQTWVFCSSLVQVLFTARWL